MGFYDAIRVGAAGAAGDFTVNRSLRFNDGDSASLTRSPSSSGNQSTFTFSWWQKITQPNDYPITFSVGSTSITTGFWEMRLGSLGLYLRFKDSTTVVINSNDKFRDPSAWYHCVIAVDTTQATSSNRIKLYVNNRQITSFQYENYPSQNFNNFRVNSSDQHQWGFGKSSSGAVDGPLDGYLAEINFIDGQQLTPSSFAETDATTGQWNPIDTSGLTFGTNGYRLQFADNSGTTATTLGKDSSGNGNNFTPNNFSVSTGAGNDSLEDTPTNNFATLNPLSTVHTENIQSMLSNGNLDYTPSGNYSIVKSTIPFPSSGKWYVEAKINTTTGGSAGIGVQRLPATSYSTNSYLSYQCNDYCYSYQGGGIITKGSTSNTTVASSLEAFAANDILAILFDADNNQIKWYNNNTLIYTLDLSAAPDGFYINDGEWVFAFMGYGGDGTINVNFGQRAFSYTPPTGYQSLCSANLTDPTILLPNKHFNTLLYTGNGGTNAISGLSFQPDWIWGKERSPAADRHWLADSVRGKKNTGYYLLCSNNTDSDTNDAPPDGITAINSDGFTLGANSSNTDGGWSIELNQSGGSYVAWNWNAGDIDGKTYTVTVVSDSGNKYRFDGFGTSAVTLDLAEGGTYIFNYPSAHPLKFSTTADGTHGGGSEYTTGVTHNSSTQVTIVVAASAPQLFYYCSIHSGMGGAVNTNSTLGSSNFSGSIQSTVKANATAGFSIVTYTRNGSSITVGHGLGVAPNIYLRKRRDSSDNWIAYNTILDGSMDYLVLNSNGVKVDSGLTVPTSTKFYDDGSGNMVVYAFSEVAGYSKFGSYKGNGSSDGPFVYTGFRPAWIMIKISGYTGNWIIFDNKRDPFNYCDTRLFANLTNADTGSYNVISMLSNGFKFENQYDGSWNRNNTQFVYFAFAEAPFKNARAR